MDQILPSPSSAEDSSFADSSSAGREVLEKHLGAATPEKRGRGRPPGSKSKAPMGAPPDRGVAGGSNPQPRNVAPVPTIDPKLVAESFARCFKSVDTWICRRDERIIKKLTGDDDFARQVADEIRASDVEVEGLSQNFASCCVAYNWLGNHAPAVFFGVGLLAYGGRVLMAQTTINQVAAKVRADVAARKTTLSNAIPPQAVQAPDHGTVGKRENEPRA